MSGGKLAKCFVEFVVRHNGIMHVVVGKQFIAGGKHDTPVHLKHTHPVGGVVADGVVVLTFINFRKRFIQPYPENAFFNMPYPNISK